MCRFTLEMMRVALNIEGFDPLLSISTSNEIFPEFSPFSDHLLPIKTFRRDIDVLLTFPNFLFARQKLLAWLTKHKVESVVVLMPHLWTPLVANSIKQLGIRYSVVIHDAKPHLGDPTGLATSWLLKDAHIADTVITLSQWVTNQLIAQGTVPAERIKTLFLPDAVYPYSALTSHAGPRCRKIGDPLRILFFGRLLPYKGLPLFIDAMEILAREKIPIEVSVCGDGDLEDITARLEKIKAVIVNRWLSEKEIGELLVRHDVVVLTHSEASQSGVVSAALGAGLPVVVPPVGGLAEQIQPREAGIVATGLNAPAIADCVRTLALDPSLYNTIAARISSDNSRSMTQFVRNLIDIVSTQN